MILAPIIYSYPNKNNQWLEFVDGDTSINILYEIMSGSLSSFIHLLTIK